jgi:hypothetical protein
MKHKLKWENIEGNKRLGEKEEEKLYEAYSQ